MSIHPQIAGAGSPLPEAGVRPSQDRSTVSAWLAKLGFDWGAATQGLRRRRLAKNETLFSEGQAAETVYVIEDGRVRLTSYAFDGKERHLMIIGPNGLVGDCGLLCTRSYIVSAVAASDAVVCAVPVAVMQSALEQDPVLLRQHQELSSMRFRIMLRHLAMQGSNSGTRRVCHHLLDLANSYGASHRDGTVISISFTQQEMGSICGLSRVSVSNVFTMLERERVIARAGRLVIICDSTRLEQLSNS